MEKLDVNALKEDLMACDFIKSPDDNLSLEELIDGYNKTLSTILNNHCPEEHKTVRPRPLQAWFNDELKQLKRKKRAAERKWRKCNSAANKEQYCNIKNNYHDAIKITRLEFSKKSLLKDQLDVKKVYKTVNKLTGDDIGSVLPTHADSDSGKKKLADNMSDFFSNKIDNIRVEIPKENEKNTAVPILDKPTTCTSVLTNFSTVTPQELKNIIRSMNNKHNPNDPIPTWLIKECIDELSPVVMMMINKSLNLAKFPT